MALLTPLESRRAAAVARSCAKTASLMARATGSRVNEQWSEPASQADLIGIGLKSQASTDGMKRITGSAWGSPAPAGWASSKE